MQKSDLNTGWLFTRVSTGEQCTVTLPHDAIINTDRNPDQRNYFLLAGFEGGQFLYEKDLVLPAGKTCVLEFEACYCMTKVYVNGKLAADHPYGFTPIQIHLNPYLENDNKAHIRVEVSIPKEGHGRWYTGGGLYRPAHLYVGEDAFFDIYGLKVTTLSHDPAVIRVETSSQGGESVRLCITRKCKSSSHESDSKERAIGLKAACTETASGRNTACVEAASRNNTACAETTSENKQSCPEEATVSISEGSAPICVETKVQAGKSSVEITIPGAALWSAEHPNLYEVKAELISGGAVCDVISEDFGIRTIELVPDKGLFINGEHLFLRGGCIHNDNGVIGVVNNDATELHRARNLKKSGFNALRSAHHPMSRSLMKACDEVGLYVMDEAFDYWYRPKGGNPHTQRFLDTFENDTKLMVQDAYNHPSVIMYSIGNEIPEAGSLKGVRVGKRIVDAIHSLDLSRPTTLCPSVHWLREYLEGTCYLDTDEDEWMAQSPENKKADWQHYMKIFMGAVLNLPDSEKGMAYPPTYIRADEDATKNLYPYLDVAGYNYFEDRYEELHKLHPERLLLGTETRGTMIVDTMRFAREHPYVIGDFIWTLQEHLGEANCCGMHYDSPEEQAIRDAGKDPGKCYPWLINYGGTIDLIGTILPSIHLYEFAWDPDKHGLYLATQPPIHDGLAPKADSYRWTDTVEGWTYEGCEGKPTFVDAYTDAASVVIFVNGREAGRADVKDYFVKIPCTYEPGELLAVGLDAAGRELYRTSLHTAGNENMITAVPDRTELVSGGQDFCFIDVRITDADGELKLLPERRVHIAAEGPVEIAGFGSAYHKNEEKYDQESHLTYLGRRQAVVRTTEGTGPARIRFSAEGVPETVVELTVK